MKERTLAILKPDAVSKHHIGDILQRMEQQGLHPIGIKLLRLSLDQAKQFYGVHAERPFFKDLVSFMTSGPVVVVALEGDDAVSRYRELMGATDPKKAAAGTLRADFAESIDANAVHGSDSLENAKTEVAFFFKPDELVSYVGSHA